MSPFLAVEPFFLATDLTARSYQMLTSTLYQRIRRSGTPLDLLLIC